MNRRRWVIFGVCASLFLMSQFYRVSSAIIAPDLSRDLGLNSKELGLLGAIFFYVFALVQPPLGLLLDRIGARISMAALNSIAVLGAIIFAHAGSLTDGSWPEPLQLLSRLIAQAYWNPIIKIS